MKEPDNNIFRTLKGYEIRENSQMTHAMEDYLEMIYRCFQEESSVRVNTLANRLNVKPSSSSKMVNNLSGLGYVKYEKYGVITLTPKGLELGAYLLFRHDLLNSFFCTINGSVDELEQTEKVEHFIHPRTLYNIERLTRLLKSIQYDELIGKGRD